MLAGRCFPHPARTGRRARLLAVITAGLLLWGFGGGPGRLRAGEEGAAHPWIFPLRSENQAALPWWAGDGWRLGGEENAAVENPAPESQSTADAMRSRLAAEVKNGRLVARDDGERKITFRPLRRTPDPSVGSTAAFVASPPESVKEPGPLEDAALAAAVRSRIAADPELGKLGVSVASQLGRLTLHSTGSQGSPTPEQTAALLTLALAVDNVIEVTADLPAAPAPHQP